MPSSGHMLRLTDWNNQDQMMVLYVFGNLSEPSPCQGDLNRPFFIQEYAIHFFLCFQLCTCLKAGAGMVVAQQLGDSVTHGEQDQSFKSFQQYMEAVTTKAGMTKHPCKEMNSTHNESTTEICNVIFCGNILWNEDKMF